MESQTDTSPSVPSRRGVLKLAGAASVLPVAAGLASCGGSSSGGNKDLTFIYLGDASQQATYKKLFAEFNKEHPEITLKATGIASGDWATFVNTVSTQIAGGKTPDIVDVATEGQQLFASKKGLLTPLDDFIKKDRKLVDDYYADIDPHLRQWTKKYGSTDGKTYFMPGGYNTVVMYCSKKIFKKAGVDLPGKDWSWDDFTAAGKKIKSATGAYMIPAGYGFPFGDIMPWLLTNGASTMNADWTRGTYNTPEAVEAAEFVRSLVADKLAPIPGGNFDAAAKMKQGKLACFGGGRYAQPGLESDKLVDEVQIVNWPTNNGKNGSPAGWDAWPIFEASKNKEAAWTFIKFLMSKKAGKFYATVGGTNIPARNSIATSPAFTDGAPAGTKLLPAAIEYATPIPSPAKGAEAQKIITQAWQAIVTGHGAAKPTLDAANKKLSKLLS